MAYTKRRRDTYEDDNGAGPVDAPAGSAQVLPVADLPEDFDGEAEDGATYLALASRENDKLPFVTRVDPPALLAPKPKPAPAPTAKRQRHPVLPRESWVVVFSAHFAAYKASLAGRLEKPMPKPGAKVDVKAVVEVEVEVSEEEAMNGGDGDGGGEGSGSGPGAPRGKPDFLPAAYDADGWIAYVDGVDTDMDEEEAMNAEFVPREPLVSVLRRLDTTTILALLSHLTPDRTLPAHRARWLFALLSALEPHLSSDDLSTLRSFARDVAAFISTRYLAALEAGELAYVPVYPGFYSGDSTAEPVAPLSGGVELGAAGWTLGAAWKRDMDSRPKSEVMRPDGTGADEDIARAWLVVFCVVAGWAQRDLVDEFERALGKLPLPP